jgi:UDP-glucose 4-epimerase
MNCLVTGAAGFIASRLCLRALKEGFKVTGIDSFVDFYPRWIKERNIESLRGKKNFKLIIGDLNRLDLKGIVEKADIIFHHAAQPGVRTSWGKNFSLYTRNNIEATQKLLEAAKNTKLKKFVYASSSSVYGLCPDLPMSETSQLRPFSPYGVTKLAAENLCLLYYRNYGLPAVSLRFFTVYGPGQRPDMAFHRFFKAMLENAKISLYGDGKQTRDFTYIDDATESNIACLDRGKAGEVYNIGGGCRIRLEEIFPLVESICQKKIRKKQKERQLGDVLDTYASIEKAKKDLGFTPQTRLHEGLREEWTWIQWLYSS